MELIQSVFDQLRSDFQKKLDVLEKQVVMILSQTSHPAPVPEDFLKIKESMNALTNRIGKMEYRLQTIEVSKQATPHHSPIPTSAGLEGLLLRTINLPSPILNATQNSIHPVHPIVQRSVDIVEPDEDALQGELAAQAGGLDIVEDNDEELVEEVVEEEEEEDVVVEEEAEEEAEEEEAEEAEEEEAEEAEEE